MTLRLLLFGAPSLLEGGRVSALDFERRWQVVAYLALKRGWVPRAEIATLLWPDQEQRLALTNLRKALHRLQSLPLASFLDTQGSSLRISIETDVADFERALSDDRFADATLLHRGPLLAGFDDPGNEAWIAWLAYERERLTAAWRTAVHRQLARDIGIDERIELAARLLNEDPLDEAALRAYLLALVRNHQQPRALQVYREFERRLADELGLEPGAELQALQRSLVGASANTTAVSPAPRDDEFVGRAVELRRIAELLSQSDCRLLSITGPGGIGKTRLARRALAELADSFRDGTVFVALDDLASGEDIGGRLARDLGIALSGSAEPMQQAIEHLRARRMLLALDNFEHLVDRAATLETLLAGCPGVKLIVTSRVRLGIAGEWLFPLEGLPWPEDEDADRAEAFDAVRLFIRAAQRVCPSLIPDQERAAIVDICRQLDGLPLAIEMAAAWTRALSCAAIATELRRGPELLRASDRSRPARHASVEDVFEQSWSLLSEIERDALARLALFRGGFTAEAARAVAGASLPVLGALIDKSLLRRDGERMTLHPLVQQLAARRLGDGERRDAAERAHGRRFHDLLHQLRREIEFGNRDALSQVDAEFENIRSAWRWAVEHRESRLLGASTHSLMHYCDHRSRLDEGLALLREAMSAGLGDDPHLEALVLVKAAHLEYRKDRYRDAIETASRGLGKVLLRGQAETRAQALGVLGTCFLRLGHHQQARIYFGQALKLASQCSDLRFEPSMMSSLALVEKAAGNYGEAQRISLDVLARQRRLGDVASEALSLNNLAALHLERLEFDLAASYLKPALELCERHGLETTRGFVLTNLSGVAVGTGDLTAAQAYAQKALEHAQRIGNRFVTAYLKLMFVRFALAHGELDRARAWLRSGMELALEVGRPALLSQGVIAFSEVLAGYGEAACARAVANFIAEQPGFAQTERDEVARVLARLPASGPPLRWPGWSLDDLTRRVISETEIAYRPLIAALAETGAAQ